MKTATIPRIDPEFHALIPPLTEEEYRQLEENILRDGCRDALVVWAQPPNSGKCPECGHDVLRLCKFYDVNYVTDRFGHESKEYEAVHEWICGAISDPVGSEHFPETPLRGDQFCDMDEDGCGEFYPVEIECLVLIDGHNRMKICEQHGLSYRWDNILTFRSRDEAKAWIIRNQFGRRNIQPYQRAELALELEPLIAKKAKENQERSGREFGKGCQKSDEPIEPVDTKREVAKVAGLSHDTIAKAKKIRDEAPEEVKDKLRRGEISINKAYGDIRRIERRFQNTEGENMLGAEIKRDGHFRKTGNLYFETAEKSHPDNPDYIPSGIWREDNSWLYVIGDEKTIYIFSTKYLRMLQDTKGIDGKYKYQRKETPTSQGWVMPLKDSEKYCLRRIDKEDEDKEETHIQQILFGDAPLDISQEEIPT